MKWEWKHRLTCLQWHPRDKGLGVTVTRLFYTMSPYPDIFYYEKGQLGIRKSVTLTWCLNTVSPGTCRGLIETQTLQYLRECCMNSPPQPERVITQPSIKGFALHVVERNEIFSQIIISVFHILIGRQKAHYRVLATKASCHQMSKCISRKDSTLPDPMA